MKVIFIVGPQGNKYISTYNDTVKITPARPWLHQIPQKFKVNENGKKQNTRDHVRIDIATAFATKWVLDGKTNQLKKKGITFLIVPANKITATLVKRSDFVFHHWFDKLVRPPIKSLSTKTIPNGKYQSIINANAHKMFPPVKYQHLVYDKCAYYKFFEQNGINTAPTLCVSRKDYTLQKNKTIDKIWKISKIWKEMFGKPVHGTDSGDVGRPYDFGTRDSIASYIKRVFKSKNKSPAIVFQKFMTDFELNFPQIRLYYLGEKYKYSVVEWKTPIPNGTSRLSSLSDASSLYKAKRFASKVHAAIRPFFKGMPKYLTRIDVGCCMEEGKVKLKNLFLNEIEILAGLYLFYDGERRLNFDYEMAKQAAKVILFKSKKN